MVFPAGLMVASPPSLSLADQMMAMASGAFVTQMLHVAAELNLADALADGEREVGDLAGACGADPEALFRLLRGLASLGVFRETRPRHFQLTPLAELLRSDHPQSLRNFARLLGDEHYLSWDALLHCVQSGESGFHHRYGTSVFAWYQEHPERSEVFDQAMGDLSRQQTAAILAAYSFAEVRHLVDVGGGRGELLKTVLQAHGQLQGTLYDQPWVVDPVEVPEALRGRLMVRGGDFFTAVPEGADAYLLKHILHDWDDGSCLKILQAIRSAMAPGARVLIVEQVIPPGNDPFPGKLLDLNMLVMTQGGRERTPEGFSRLLGQAGLELSRILPTAAPVSVIEAVAAP
jgi:hypothetical protein